MTLDAAFHFGGLNGFAALRREAADGSPDAQRAVAQQFEALFLQTVLQNMRAASPVEGGLLSSGQLESHQRMHDQQLALALSRRGGVGLAAAMLPHLGVKDAAEPPITRRAGPSLPPPGAAAFQPRTPEEFVMQVWPHAQRAARRLGTDPEVLVAQSALESGWGRKMIRGADGRPSFNLLGIKAGDGWHGATVSTPTLEYVDGVAERRRATFRVYGDLAEAFDDYAQLIKSRPRYTPVLAAEDGHAYAQALQDAGYATDPGYAAKIQAILQRGLPGRDRPAPLAAEAGR